VTRKAALVVLACTLAVTAWPLAKKKKEDETQVLQLPKELPAAVVAETRRLTFHVSPLSGKGLLSAQVREALKSLNRSTSGQTVVKLRAFVAGTGDLRRVRDIVSETYAERKQALPALSLVQAGGLPMEGAQVVLEAIAVGRKETAPNGLAWISAQTATSPHPLDPVAPLTQRALEALRTAVRAAGAEAADVARVTCFFSSLEKLEDSRKQVQAEYGRASLNYVQTQRAPGQALAACEAVARLRQAPAKPVEMLDPPGLAPEQGQSQVALVGAPRVVLTGTQVCFGFQEADARLAFERLMKAVEQAGGGAREIAFASCYPLSASIAAQVRKVRAAFFNAARAPAGSMVLFESLPSMDAGFAVDVVAAKE